MYKHENIKFENAITLIIIIGLISGWTGYIYQIIIDDENFNEFCWSCFWIVNISFFIFLCSIFTKYIIQFRNDFKKCPHGVFFGKTKLKCQTCFEINRLLEIEKRKIIENRKTLNEIKIFNDLKIKELKAESYKSLLKNKKYLQSIDPFEFEELIAKIYRLMGFNAMVTSNIKDGGKDIILEKNTEKYYVECKRFGDRTIVTRPDIQKLYGAMTADNIKNGIFVCTSRFTSDAIEYVNKQNIPIELIDLLKLQKMIINEVKDDKPLFYFQKCNFQNNEKEIPCGKVVNIELEQIIYENKCSEGHILYAPIKSINDFIQDKTTLKNICPKCGSKLRLIKNRFWGCTNYPKCEFTKNKKTR